MLADAESYAGRLPYEATCGLVIFVRLGLDYILIVVVATWATLLRARTRVVRVPRDVLVIAGSALAAAALLQVGLGTLEVVLGRRRGCWHRGVNLLKLLLTSLVEVCVCVWGLYWGHRLQRSVQTPTGLSKEARRASLASDPEAFGQPSKTALLRRRCHRYLVAITGATSLGLAYAAYKFAASAAASRGRDDVRAMSTGETMTRRHRRAS
jgi:hypothetical protein